MKVNLFDVSPTALRTFHAVTTLGSVELAATQLGVSASAVSQRIKALEGHVGTVLVQRTRPLTPTATGEVVHRLASQYMLAAQEAESELARRNGTGPLRRVTLVVNSDALATWIMTALEQVALSEHLALEIVRDDESVAADYLQRGLAMAAVSSRPVAAPGTRVVPLGTWRYWPVAHPQFIQRYLSNGFTKRAANRAPVLRYDHNDLLPLNYLRAHVGAAVNPPEHFIPDVRLLVRAAGNHLGWILMPATYRSYLPATQLLTHIPGTEPTDVNLYWHQWAIDSPTLDTLAGAVIEQATKTSAKEMTTTWD